MYLTNTDLTGIVLAGGQSKRMGFNKAEAIIEGVTMLQIMIDKLIQVAPDVLVSSGQTTYRNISLPQITDTYPQYGPLGGIFSVLKRSKSPLNIAVSCDIPFVPIALLQYLIDNAKKSEALITVPIDHKGQIQMMCAVYHSSVLPYIKERIDSGMFKMKALLDDVSVNYIDIKRDHPLYFEHAFMNVNNPTTLRKARQLWNKPKR